MKKIFSKISIPISLVVIVAFYYFFSQRILDFFMTPSDTLGVILSLFVGVIFYVVLQFIINKKLSTAEKKLVSILLSFVFGFLFNYVIASTWASILAIDTLLGSVVFLLAAWFIFYIILQVIIFREVNKVERRIILVVYLIAIVTALFSRQYGPSIFDVNPLSFFVNFLKDSTSAYVSVINIAIVIPLATILYINKIKLTFPKVLLVFCAVEGLQFLLKRGICDLGDIVLYIIGYFVGILLLNFVKGSRLSFIVNYKETGKNG